MKAHGWLRGIGSAFFHRSRVDCEMEEELREHIRSRAEGLERSGMSRAEAERQAPVEFGSVERFKEECREETGAHFLESLAQDFRYGWRMARKSPGFAAIAALTLALGIGANSAIFSLINAVLLKTLPVSNPQELVLFSDSPVGGSNSGRQTGRWIFFSNDNYEYFRQRNPFFNDLCAFQSGWSNWEIDTPVAGARPEMAHGRLVSGNFFSFLGLRASAGRLFVPSDDSPGAPPAVVLSYRFWTRQLHGDPSVIGKPLEINRMEFTVIGVAPREFRGVKYDNPDFWLPLVFQPQVMSTEAYASDPQMYWLDIMARLKPGVTLAKAQTVAGSELKEMLATQAQPETPDRIAQSYIQLAPGAWGISYFRSTYTRALQLLAGVLFIVLLIACANIANLLLSRSSAREKEMAVRLAIGASRRRLVRQLVTENMLLAALGGAVGILAAGWGARVFASLVMGVKTSGGIPLDGRVFLFTAAVTILAGILFGLGPALQCSRVDLAWRGRGAARRRFRFGFANGLVAFQIAACVVLLVGAGLFLRTLQRLADQHLGFDEEHILVAHIDPEAAAYMPVQTPALYQALIDRAEAIPGVLSATVASSEPFSGSSWTSNFSIEGEPPKPASEMTVHKELVGPHYFETEGIPILLGRDIGPQDRPGTALVTVINESMAREYFTGVNPIGRRISLGSPFNEKTAMTIVGVTSDARYYSLRDPVPPMEFCAAFQVPSSDTHNAGYAQAVEIRVRGNPEAIAGGIRAALGQVSATLPVGEIHALSRELSDSLQENRGYAELFSAFGMVALLLACIGVYGTMADRVSRRTQEIGIRVALGAQRRDVLGLLMRECLILSLAGLAVGVPVALACTKVIASRLFGIQPTDPVTFGAVAILLTAVALGASLLPARRAMRVDPVTALRHE